jgi:hypothetical protein
MKSNQGMVEATASGSAPSRGYNFHPQVNFRLTPSDPAGPSVPGEPTASHRVDMRIIPFQGGGLVLKPPIARAWLRRFQPRQRQR